MTTTRSFVRTDLTGARASSLVVCTRMAVYQHLGAPADDFDDRTYGYFRRGHAWARIVLEPVAEQLRAQGRRPRLEEEIPWPAADPVAVGHADFYIPHEARIIEITSNAGAELGRHKALQAALYALNHPRAERADVLAVDTHTGEERLYPIDVDYLSDEIREREASFLEGARGGTMPERVAEDPTHRPCEGCVFRRHCWADWERPAAEARPEFAAEVAQLARLEDLIAVNPNDGGLRGQRDELRRRLRPYLEDRTDYVAGGIRVRRTDVAGRRTLSLADMEKAGHRLPDALEAFVSTGQPSERWTLKRLDEEGAR